MTDTIQQQLTSAQNESLKDLPPYQSFQCKNPDGVHTCTYLQYGERSAPNYLFFVHGLTGDATNGKYLGEYFSTHYNFCVFAIDLVGRGNSDQLSNKTFYHYGQYASDIATWIEHILANPDLIPPSPSSSPTSTPTTTSPPAPATATATTAVSTTPLTTTDKNIFYLGISLGGLIAQIMSTLYPTVSQLIKAYCLIDIGAQVPYHEIQRIHGYLQQDQYFLSRYESTGYFYKIYANHFGPFVDHDFFADRSIYALKARLRRIRDHQSSTITHSDGGSTAQQTTTQAPPAAATATVMTTTTTTDEGGDDTTATNTTSAHTHVIYPDLEFTHKMDRLGIVSGLLNTDYCPVKPRLMYNPDSDVFPLFTSTAGDDTSDKIDKGDNSSSSSDKGDNTAPTTATDSFSFWSHFMTMNKPILVYHGELSELLTRNEIKLMQQCHQQHFPGSTTTTGLIPQSQPQPQVSSSPHVETGDDSTSHSHTNKEEEEGSPQEELSSMIDQSSSITTVYNNKIYFQSLTWKETGHVPPLYIEEEFTPIHHFLQQFIE